MLVPSELTALKKELKKRFEPLIKGQGGKERERENNFFTKALAAYALAQRCGITDQEAVAASTDGSGDNGIDAIHVTHERSIYLVQAKYIERGSGQPQLADLEKFISGARELLELNFNHFDPRMTPLLSKAKRALEDEACQTWLLLVHTGGGLSAQSEQRFADLERAYKTGSQELLKTQILGLEALSGLLLKSQRKPPICATIELADFGCLTVPYEAYYGRLKARDLVALERKHGEHLIARNIRSFKGKTPVNSEIELTLRKEAQHLFYYNNGLTFLCKSMKLILGRQINRERGTFSVQGLSLINGAQTLGALANCALETEAELLATFICIERADEGFGDQVTQKRNCQNEVEPQDFASIDPLQVRWRELLRSFGVDYRLKLGKVQGKNPNAFELKEAALARACVVTGNFAPTLLAYAKDKPQRLFESKPLPGTSDKAKDKSKFSAYRQLFPEELSPEVLWSQVQQVRFLRAAIAARARAEPGPRQKILREGTWLLIHLVLLRLKGRLDASFALEAQDHEALSRELDKVAEAFLEQISRHSWPKKLASLFKNLTEIIAIKNGLLAQLAAKETRA